MDTTGTDTALHLATDDEAPRSHPLFTLRVAEHGPQWRLRKGDFFDTKEALELLESEVGAQHLADWEFGGGNPIGYLHNRALNDFGGALKQAREMWINTRIYLAANAEVADQMAANGIEEYVKEAVENPHLARYLNAIAVAMRTRAWDQLIDLQFTV